MARNSKVIFYKRTPEPFVSAIDENHFIKRRKALQRYFKKSYKYLIFEVLPTLLKSGKIEGHYSLELPIDELFKQVYGSMVLTFTVKNDVAFVENITPDEILDACYMGDLPIYKGIPYRDKKDLFKIKLMEAKLSGER